MENIAKSVKKDGKTASLKGKSISVNVVDNLQSQSSTDALSARQGKVLKEELDSVFLSVSNGKKKLASAITDKGVDTEADATFETMATNIGKISRGGGGTGLSVPVVYDEEYTGTLKVLYAVDEEYYGRLLDV